MEELAIAYPQLDRNMIDIAIRFDEQMQEKYGEDYHWEDHKDELIPKELRDDINSAQTVVSPDNDREGEDRQSGAEGPCTESTEPSCT